MKTIINQLSKILTKKEKINLILLILIFCVSTTIEVLGIASILPYISILTNPETDLSKNVFNIIKDITNETDKNNIILIFGYSVLIAILCGTMLSGMTNWLILRFSLMRIDSISKLLLKNYLEQDYEYFIKKTTTNLLQNMLTEVSTVVGGVLTPFVQLITRVVVVLMVVTMLLSINYKATILAFIIFLMFYVLIYLYKNAELKKLGENALKCKTDRYHILLELFNGIKEIKLCNLERKYYENYASASEKFADVESKSQLISLLPRYLLEMIVFGGVILVTLILVRNQQSFSDLMPMLSLYCVAAYKLLPSMQQIFINLASISYSSNSLKSIIEECEIKKDKNSNFENNNDKRIFNLSKNISFEDVCFKYPGNEGYSIGPINIEIKACKMTALIGASGSGKSTVLDLILGLLEPTSGYIKVDGILQSSHNRKNMQALIGYVPQNIFLMDGSIAENIAFGVSKDNIDLNAIEKAAKAANIYNFINELPEKFNTHIMEHGKNLSGGQRQRVAIARALYKDPAILVLDEATSALDADNENEIFEQLKKLRNEKTIIVITHKEENLNGFDIIYAVNEGEVVECRATI